MPELPEVETVVRGLRPLLVGRRLRHVIVRRRDLRTRAPRDLARRREGRLVVGVERRAKYVLIRLDDGPQGEGLVLVIHLGMSGRLVAGRIGAGRAGLHDHFEFETDDGTRVCFTAPRRFGLVALVAGKAIERDKRFAGLGPEPLGKEFTPAYLAQALARRRTAIKAALLDQRIVTGIGNIYAAEALFEAGISPRRQAGAIGPARARRLVAAIRDVLARAIAAGGSTSRDYVQASGKPGWFQNQWAVYNREGQPCRGCRCGGAVKRIVQGGRSTFYCARRQR